MDAKRDFQNGEQDNLDERVAFTRRNWTGRFLRAEVTYGDYQRIMSKISTWDQWLPAWAEIALEYERHAKSAEERGGRHSAAEAWRRAAMCWHFGKFNWFEDLDKARHAQVRLNECYAKALWSLTPPGKKVCIPYCGAEISGILRIPAGVRSPPIVLLIGGLDSVKEELQIVADYFLRREIATLAIDGPGQGETAARLNIEPASEMPVKAVIDFLEGIAEVDARHLGVYGQSLGGYYVIRASAFEKRIKAAIDSAGPYAVADHWDKLPPMTRAGYQYRLGADGPQQALEYVRKLDLAGIAEKVSCPLLVMHGTADVVVPVSNAERIAEEAQAAVLWKFDGGNHSLSNRHWEARNGMADWMVEHIGGRL